MPSSDNHSGLLRLESALADAADDLTSHPRPQLDGDPVDLWETTLARLTAAAVAHVPGAAHAGMTMRDRDGGLTTWAPTHPVVADLDRVQDELGEGPSTEPSGLPEILVVDDLGRHSDRWPGFAAAAARAGIRGLISCPLAPRDATPGWITFYATVSGAFDPTARAIARAFAMQAALVVHGAEQVSDLRRAIASRDLIGQAKGILMERFGLDDRKAFDLLVRSSQDTNVKLADVARWLAGDVAARNHGEEPAVPRPPER